MPYVNLLPQSYRRAQARRRRIRIGTGAGAALLAVELLAGVVLHVRAGRTLELVGAAQAARSAADTVRQKMQEPAAESALLNQHLRLARRLRTTHPWSRLMGVFAQAASSHVTLTAMSTDPPRWSPGLGVDEPAAAPAANAKPAARLLQGMTVRGCAADYEELSRFIAGLQAVNAFASLNLREAKRDKYLERDVISFELQCRW